MNNLEAGNIKYKPAIFGSHYASDGDGEVEYEDEDNVEYEGEDESGVSEQESPKYRQLIRIKKLEFKAQYGKAHFTSQKQCKMVPTPSTCYKNVNVPYPCPTWQNPGKICYKSVSTPYPCSVNKEVCVQVPIWVWGWRKKWREFKQQGGLAQLKQQSMGLTPPPPVGLTPSPLGLQNEGTILRKKKVESTKKPDSASEGTENTVPITSGSLSPLKMALGFGLGLGILALAYKIIK